MIRAFFSSIVGSADVKGKRSKILVRAAVSIIILAVLIWWVSSEALIKAITAIPIQVWLFVIIGFLFGHLLSAFKWRMLLHAVNVKIGAVESVRAHGAGLFANLCLPSVVGGDLIRAGMVIRKHKKIEAIALGSLVDRINDTFALVLLAAIAGFMIPGFTESRSGAVLAYVSILLLVCVISGLLIVRFIHVDMVPGKLRGVVSKVKEALGSLFSSPLVAMSALLLSMAIQTGFILLNTQLAQAMGIHLPLAVWFLAWPLAKLVALAPVSLGGIGVREAALAVFLAPFGVESALAVAQSLTWEAVLIISGILSGFAVALSTGSQNVLDPETKGEKL